MERIRLTPQRIIGFTCPSEKKQAFLWDKESPRLAVRATVGSKSFIFESKLNGITIRRTIGKCSAWTVEAARAEANRLQTLIDQGLDPRELDKEQAKQKAAQEYAQEAASFEQERQKRFTLKALCDAYVTLLESRGKTKSAAATRSAFKCHVFTPHPALANTYCGDVTAYDIAAIVRLVKETGKERMAGILRSYLSAAFNAARRAPFDASLPAALIPFNVKTNPVEPVATIPVRAGDRHLSAEELARYIAALGNNLPDQALRLALYSGGQRMAQLLRARVADYNPENQTLRLYDPKGRRVNPREHLLPLATSAAAIVDALVERAKGKSSPFLFSAGDGLMHASTPVKRASEVSAEMGGETFTLRDLRRTCETMLSSIGISSDIRAQLLSHGITGVQAIFYDRNKYEDVKRSTLIRWERYLEEIKSGKPQEKVIYLAAR